jgi:hypothetical protein
VVNFLCSPTFLPSIGGIGFEGFPAEFQCMAISRDGPAAANRRRSGCPFLGFVVALPFLPSQCDSSPEEQSPPQEIAQLF